MNNSYDQRYISIAFTIERNHDSLLSQQYDIHENFLCCGQKGGHLKTVPNRENLL